MAKKFVQIIIEVDLESEVAKEWGKPNDYFEFEVAEALAEIRDDFTFGRPKKASSGVIEDSKTHYKYKISNLK